MSYDFLLIIGCCDGQVDKSTGDEVLSGTAKFFLEPTRLRRHLIKYLQIYIRIPSYVFVHVDATSHFPRNST